MGPPTEGLEAGHLALPGNPLWRPGQAGFGFGFRWLRLGCSKAFLAWISAWRLGFRLDFDLILN